MPLPLPILAIATLALMAAKKPKKKTSAKDDLVSETKKVLSPLGDSTSVEAILRGKGA
jgi:hypothetical protein